MVVAFLAWQLNQVHLPNTHSEQALRCQGLQQRKVLFTKQPSYEIGEKNLKYTSTKIELKYD